MEEELEAVLNNVTSTSDVVGMVVLDKAGEIIASRGDVADLSASDIMRLKGSLKEDDGTGAFKIGYKKLLLRNEGDILVAVITNGHARSASNA